MYFIIANDVPGSNDGAGVFRDEQVFRDVSVTSVGQIIGIVLAKSKTLAQSYAKKVEIKYTETPLEPVLTIEVTALTI